MPASRSLSRPAADIQSVVHAGVSCVWTVAVHPPRRAACSTRRAIASMAGQPLYVGVITTLRVRVASSAVT